MSEPRLSTHEVESLVNLAIEGGVWPRDSRSLLFREFSPHLVASLACHQDGRTQLISDLSVINRLHPDEHGFDPLVSWTVQLAYRAASDQNGINTLLRRLAVPTGGPTVGACQRQCLCLVYHAGHTLADRMDSIKRRLHDSGLGIVSLDLSIAYGSTLYAMDCWSKRVGLFIVAVDRGEFDSPSAHGNLQALGSLFHGRLALAIGDDIDPIDFDHMDVLCGARLALATDRSLDEIEGDVRQRLASVPRTACQGDADVNEEREVPSVRRLEEFLLAVGYRGRVTGLPRGLYRELATHVNTMNQVRRIVHEAESLLYEVAPCEKAFELCSLPPGPPIEAWSVIVQRAPLISARAMAAILIVSMEETDIHMPLAQRALQRLAEVSGLGVNMIEVMP